MTKLVGPAVVIDIADACAKSADYLLTAEDVTKWESQHGRLPDGSIVFSDDFGNKVYRLKYVGK